MSNNIIIHNISDNPMKRFLEINIGQVFQILCNKNDIFIKISESQAFNISLNKQIFITNRNDFVCLKNVEMIVKNYKEEN